MNEKVFRTLEFYKITDRLSGLAASAEGKRRCGALLPMTEYRRISAAQENTADALNRLLRRGDLSFEGIRDVKASLKRISIGGTLNTRELLDISSLLGTADSALRYAFPEDGRGEITDSLSPLFERLDCCQALMREIRRCIISEDEISDDASPGLRQTRRLIASAQDRIHSTLTGMVSGSAREYLRDALITQRNGRYCLPVKSECRGQVPGMIHDQSSSGSTVFIEPAAVVRLNNELKELELREEEEILHVLQALSEETSGYSETIADDFELLGRLDFIFAKGRLAKEMNAVRPSFAKKKEIEIREARHPLLNPEKVVPVDICLGRDYDLLIITGPNTGGKTVSLKTTGLLTLMGQSGLHIPAREHSRLAIFDEIYADIGDEQSIEQNLSTFSSHMTNIVRILSRASGNSLVLLDELCAGTDPTEGAALATSILSYLHSGGIRTMATTHYSELKIYALSTEGVENACCEFDVETLSPTYRLLTGIPGKSNAFAISKKLGLSDDIIDNAKELLSESNESFEDLLADLETGRKKIEQEEADIRKHKEEIRVLRDALEKKQEKLDLQKDGIIREANEEARRILREAKDYADQTIRDFNKFGKEGISASRMEAARSELREKIKNTEKTSQARSAPHSRPSKALKASDLHLGDSVRLKNLNLEGTVSSLPDSRGNLFVQTGILRTKTNISDLELIEEAVVTSKQYRQTSTGHVSILKSANVSTEINLIGLTVDEALAELDKYLDDAYLAHLPSVRIVHGKGTGALRKAVHGALRRNKHVKSFRLGEFGEGDYGVTVAEFN